MLYLSSYVNSHCRRSFPARFAIRPGLGRLVDVYIVCCTLGHKLRKRTALTSSLCKLETGRSHQAENLFCRTPLERRCHVGRSLATSRCTSPEDPNNVILDEDGEDPERSGRYLPKSISTSYCQMCCVYFAVYSVFSHSATSSSLSKPLSSLAISITSFMYRPNSQNPSCMEFAAGLSHIAQSVTHAAQGLKLYPIGKPSFCRKYDVPLGRIVLIITVSSDQSMRSIINAMIS